MLYTDNSEITLENDSNSSNRGRRGDDEVVISIENETENQERQYLLKSTGSRTRLSVAQSSRSALLSMATLDITKFSEPSRRLSLEGGILLVFISSPLFFCAGCSILGLFALIPSLRSGMLMLLLGFSPTFFLVSVLVSCIGSSWVHSQYKRNERKQLQRAQGPVPPRSPDLLASLPLAFAELRSNKNESTSSPEPENVFGLPWEIMWKIGEYSDVKSFISLCILSRRLQQLIIYLVNKKNLWGKNFLEVRYHKYCSSVDLYPNQVAFFFQKLESKYPEEIVNLIRTRTLRIYEEACKCFAEWELVFARWQQAQASNQAINPNLQKNIVRLVKKSEKIIKSLENTKAPLIQFAFYKETIKKWKAQLYIVKSNWERFIEFLKNEYTYLESRRPRQ